MPMTNTSQHPANVKPGQQEVVVVPGFVIVEHSIFCGKDMGLTFYVNPADIVKLLPAPVELTLAEEFVLTATRHYKSSYMGRDRFEMAIDHPADLGPRFNELLMNRAEWNIVKDDLIARKLLNRAGAITNAGRNAIE